MKKEIIKVSAKKARIPYTVEEKAKLFADGHVRSMSHVKKSKKAYKRKPKHCGQEY